MPKKRRKPPSNGVTWYFSASSQNRSFSSASFSGCLAARSLAWEKSSSQVVELPLVLVGIPDCRARTSPSGGRGRVPRDAVEPARRPSSRPCTSRDCRRSRSTAACGARPLARRRSCRRSSRRASASASMPSTSFGAGMPATFQDGRADVDDVGELRAQAALVLDPLWASERPSGRACRRSARPPACPTGTGVLPAQAQAQAIVRRQLGPAPGLDAAVGSISLSCCSPVSGMPFCMVSSLNVPVCVPSMLEPLSPQM